jgi:TolA-binding protein
LALALLLYAAAVPRSASAQATYVPVQPPPPPSAEEMKKSRDIYRVILGNPVYGAGKDTVGTGLYRTVLQLFQAGYFDSAAVQFQQFASRYPRNLSVNDALEHVLLIRENKETRDPGYEPLKIYARAVAFREAGLADSAAALARLGLERYPSARIRYHWRYLLAEIARDQGDHVSAIGLALAVADTTSRSRLAPYALKLAGDETLTMGDDPAKALRLYQALLERYPASPLAPPVRARVLEMRKKLQL